MRERKRKVDIVYLEQASGDHRMTGVCEQVARVTRRRQGEGEEEEMKSLREREREK